jgi:SAM-dependent methyltransferase
VDEASRQTGSYYDEVGWQVAGDGRTVDRSTWVDDRECARDYLDRYYARLREHVPRAGSDMLDVGCGPLEDPRYVALSEGYERRHCVDLSSVALEAARAKIGGRGVYHRGDFLDLDFSTNTFDCVLCSHSLYHVGEDRQEAVVRKMLDVARPGAPVVVAYKHDLSLLDAITPVAEFLERIRGPGPEAQPDRRPYAHLQSRGWWARFATQANVDILPLQTFDVEEQRRIFTDDEVGRAGLATLAGLEDRYPDFFSRLGRYCLICLMKD